jgi:DNA-binding HxlR family transcriptional regulator
VRRNSWSKVECPIARAADVVGDAWSIVIVRNALMGARTFQDFEARLEIPSSTLARRLDALCRHGLLRRTRYQTRPRRDAYHLTDKGRDLLGVVMALAAWGNRWLMPEGVAIQTVDADSGETVEPTVVDRKSLRTLALSTVALAAGPAASRSLRRALATPCVLGAVLEG